jgi:hypothetical protein
MGLLDDAIRDHLELKRLRGADPGVLDREEREALNPVLNDEETGQEEDLPTVQAALFPEASGETTRVSPTPPDNHHTTSETLRSTDVSDVPQETAELDMRSVLGGDEGVPPGPASPEELAIGGSRPASPPADDRNGDSQEWEVPGEPPGKPPADIGQEVPYTQGP